MFLFKRHVWESISDMSGPNLRIPNVSSRLYTQCFTYNPNVQSEIAKSCSKPITLGFQISKTNMFKSVHRVWGDNSVSLRRIWMKLGGNSSYRPPGASYTSQGPQKQAEVIKHLLFIHIRIYTVYLISFIRSNFNSRCFNSC